MRLILGMLGAATLLLAQAPPLLVFVSGNAQPAPQIPGWEVVAVQAAPNDSNPSSAISGNALAVFGSSAAATCTGCTGSAAGGGGTTWASSTSCPVG